MPSFVGRESTNQGKEFAEQTAADFDDVISVNCRGMFHCVRAQINAMKEQEPRTVSDRNPARGAVRGTIVNLGFLASYVAIPGNSPYATSKHAVLGLTKNAGELSDPCSYAQVTDGSPVAPALDSAKYDIRINCVCPSFVDTPMIKRLFDGRPAARETIENMSPMKRLAQADEIADVAIFLSSLRSSYVTGVGWIVAGGKGYA